MKTREQLIEEIEKIRVDTATKSFPNCSSAILDLIVSACEEAIGKQKLNTPLTDFDLGYNKAKDQISRNLKKLKSK